MKSLCSQFLASFIVSALMEDPGLSAEEIRRKATSTRGSAPTIQAVYKELRRLQRDQVVFKAQGRFFLSLTWLLDIRAQIERGVRNYTDVAAAAELLPAEGEIRSWQFSDIHAMDRLVVNLMVTLLRRGDSRTIYHWDPYPWYAVFHADLASPFLKEFTRSQCRAYGVIGAASPISQRVVSSQKACGHVWWIGSPSFPHRDDTALSVKFPYVISIKYPKRAVEVFKELFNHRHPFTASAVAPFHSMLFEKLTYRVTLTNNPKKASMIERSFKKLFFSEDK